MLRVLKVSKRRLRPFSTRKGIYRSGGRKRGRVSQYRGISREQVCVLVARERNKLFQK